MMPRQFDGTIVHLSSRLTAEHQTLSRAWLDRLDALLQVERQHVFPSPQLLDHVPELLREIAADLRAPAAPVFDEAPAASLPASPPPAAAAAVATPEAEPPLDAGVVGLHAVARAAALKAERHAILEALAQFRWNRRKVADYLDVSYKTLLTKMKECGISDPGGAA